MKEVVFIYLIIVAIFIAPGDPSMANVLTFEDLSSDPPVMGGDIYDGYGNLNWTNFGYINTPLYFSSDSGYSNGVVSGDYVARDTLEDSESYVETITGRIDFNSVYLTAVWNDGLNITVKGFLSGAELYSRTVVVNDDSSTKFDFNYLGVDTVSFLSFGGTDAGTSGSGTYFAMDDFDYNESAPVPEPASMLLLGTGLVGLFGFRRNLKK